VSRSAAYLAWYRLRATLRRRLGGYLALAVLVGLIGGIALASVTAARRTESSYPDYLASTNPSSLIIQPNSNINVSSAAQANQIYQHMLSRLRHLPHVTGLATADAVNAAMLTPRGGYGTVLFTQVQLVTSGDGMFTRQDRLTVTAGHRAVRANQVVATARAAAVLHLHVGSRLRLGVWASSPKPGLPPFYRKLDLTVTGIGVVSTQIVQDDIDADRTGFLVGTPALDREFMPCCTGTSYIGLQVAGGARYDAAVDQGYVNLATSIFGAGSVQLLQLLQVYNTSAIEAEAQRAIYPEAIALGVFGSGGEWTSAAVDCCLRLASATAFRGVAVDRLPGLVGGGSSGAAFDRSPTFVFDLSSGPAVGSVRLPAREFVLEARAAAALYADAQHGASRLPAEDFADLPGCPFCHRDVSRHRSYSRVESKGQTGSIDPVMAA
jgi:hypothetical protein